MAPAPPPPIDSALQTPLPTGSDDDLSDGPTVARSQGRVPVEKVAGSRRDTKGKGKEKETAPRQVKGKGRAAPTSSRKRKLDSEEEDDDTYKRGRPRGAGNYQADDVSALLDFIEKELPLGQRGWQAVHRRYTRWARINLRPERVVKSIETKFKQVSG